VPVVLIILIFQLIDMLSAGPMLFFSGENQQLIYEFSLEEIDTLKKLGSLVYIYSSSIAMIMFGIFSKIEATLVAGIIVESLRPMVNAFSPEIMAGTRSLEGYVTNFILHLIVTSIGFGIFSLILYFINKAHFLGLIPKGIINGCLGAIGIGQLKIALDCIRGVDQNLFEVFSLFMVAIFVVLLYIFITKVIYDGVFVLPSYIIALLVIFYTVTRLFYNDYSTMLSDLYDKEWLNSKESILYPKYIYDHLDLRSISLMILLKNLKHIFTIILISSIHIVVNLPAFKMGTGTDFDFSTELKAQGIANMVTASPVYFVVSYSLAVFKVGGDKRYFSIIAGCIMVLLALFGVMIKGFIPKFILSLVPGSMFVDFISSSFLNTLFYIPMFEYVLSIIVCGIILISQEYLYGMVLGLAIYLFIFTIFYTLAETKCYNPITDAKIFLFLNNNLWFLTASQFLDDLSELNKKNPKTEDEKRTLVIDAQNCPAIDWIGHDLLRQACQTFENVIFVGDPYNLRPKGLKDLDNIQFFYYKEEYEKLHCQKTAQKIKIN
ncbi:Sulfate Permease (SulP) Family, partial [Pseudoloma neurophilia]